MVEPIASKGHARKAPILFAAVTDATAREPSPFTAVCNMTLPIAVMEYCSPMGIPILQRLPIICNSGFHSSFLILKISNFFMINIRHKTPESPCESTVAHAAPSTPI